MYLKKQFEFYPSQWVALKFFNVYGINEFHKKNMISIALKTFLQIKEKKHLFKSYKKLSRWRAKEIFCICKRLYQYIIMVFRK